MEEIIDRAIAEEKILQIIYSLEIEEILPTVANIMLFLPKEIKYNPNFDLERMLEEMRIEGIVAADVKEIASGVSAQCHRITEKGKKAFSEHKKNSVK